MKLAQKLAIKYMRARLQILALVSKKKAAQKMLDLFCTPKIKATKKNPAIFEKAEKLSFKLEGHTIRGYHWPANQHSDLPAKKVLVLHGFESTIKKFDQYIAAFRKKGYEVYAFDAPAHGESGGKKINLPLYASMITQIFKHYGPIQSFLAHSFGGAALVHSLETIPHNNRTKLALIAPATESTTSIDLFFQFFQMEDMAVRKEFDKLICEKTGHTPDYFSLRRAIKHVRAGVLWFHDENDKITPISDVLKIKEDHPKNVKFIFTKHLGHRQIYRDSGVMQQVIQYL